jgi:hypothetical protein
VIISSISLKTFSLNVTGWLARRLNAVVLIGTSTYAVTVNSYVDSYVGNPQSDVAFYCNFIIWNILRNFSLSDEDLNHMHEYVSNNAASWLMMLNHSKPSSTNLNMLKQIIDGSGLDPNVIHKGRGQFNRELFDFNKQSS